MLGALSADLFAAESSARMPDGKLWTTQNLNVDSAPSYCYGDSESNCRQYGRLYTWESALRACRSLGAGWRLPTDAEWRQLAKHYGGIVDESTDKGKAAYTAMLAGGSAGFGAVLGGGRDPDGAYRRIHAHGFYWTASESGSSEAWFFNFASGSTLLNHHTAEKSRALAVRCVTDHLAGDWQGTLPFGKTGVRLVVTIAQGASGWTASEATPDDGSNPVPASSVSFDGSKLNIEFAAIRAIYEGVLNESKSAFTGTLTQGSPVRLDLERATGETSWRRDRTAHAVRFVDVAQDVKLEVVDWGGTGRPVILLAGGNNHAHGFDKFAPKLTGAYRVYGITRRGSGVSSAPPPTRANYDADRLGDDVVAVIDGLGIDKPILIGHSLAGQELSSVGSRHPNKVAGLIYLDAGYRYAYDASETAPAPPREIATIDDAIRAGGHKYTRVDVPILAIYAMPHERGITDPAKRAEADARDLAFQGAMAKAFEKGLPSAKVIWIAHADHYVFRSHEADVLREIHAFTAGLR